MSYLAREFTDVQTAACTADPAEQSAPLPQGVWEKVPHTLPTAPRPADPCAAWPAGLGARIGCLLAWCAGGARLAEVTRQLSGPPFQGFFFFFFWACAAFQPLPELLISGILKGLLLTGQVDARVDGGLLLELYTRDGVGDATMISTDFYEGIRRSALP